KQFRYKATWTSAFGAAAHTFRIKTLPGGMYLPFISYIWEDPKDRFWLPTLHLLDGRVVAVGTHSSPDSPPQGTDVKGCQVSITTAEGSSQTSVTTKTVTCQTSASPLYYPVDTISHGWQRIPAADGSPSPPVLQKEPVSSPL
ncbi:hypothetical protein CRENBAI_015132, partial [Crenichthys baileyi]